VPSKLSQFSGTGGHTLAEFRILRVVQILNFGNVRVRWPMNRRGFQRASRGAKSEPTSLETVSDYELNRAVGLQFYASSVNNEDLLEERSRDRTKAYGAFSGERGGMAGLFRGS
jgi:hypothetical protein